MSIRLDLPTVLLFYNTSLFAGAVALLHVRRHTSNPNGLLYLANSYLLLAVGAMLAWQGEEASLPESIWTHGSLFCGCLGYSFFWLGIRGMCERKAFPWWVSLPVPLLLLLAGIITKFPLQNLNRAAAFHGVAIITLIASTITILINFPKERLPSTRVLAFFTALSGCVYLLKLVMIIDGSATPNSFSIAFFLQMFCYFGIALMVVTISKERAKLQLALIAETDPLTGVGNRRWLASRLPHMIPGNSAILQLDLDHFKKTNDQFGHAIGDAVLVSFANCLTTQLRENDLLARTGGEEFVIYAPMISKGSALAIAERLRASAETIDIQRDGVRVPVTASIRVAWVEQGAVNAQECIVRADEAMYDAKQAGRNRVVLYTMARPQ